MKKFYLSFAVLALFAVWFAVGLGHPAAANGTASPLVSPNLVISQFQAGGWKVVLILPNGNNDLERVSKATRAFGIVVPNFSPITTNAWRNYRVTVDAVENITGHNFFSEIPKNTQELIERKRDKL